MDAIDPVINGETRLHVIIGDPVSQVKSPAALTPLLRARAQNAVVVPVHVAGEHVAAFLAAAELVQNLDSILVTVPHKLACFEHCRETSERARFLAAVNVMRRGDNGGWYGEMFDGIALVSAVREAGFEPLGSRALLIGAGGAGSAIALALVEAGVQLLSVHDIDRGRRNRLVDRLAQRHNATLAAESSDPTGFDLIVNASPAGMQAGDSLPVNEAHLRPEMFVACVITAPAVSPIVAAARAAGCATSTGAQMHAAQQRTLVDFMLGKPASVSTPSSRTATQQR